MFVMPTKKRPRDSQRSKVYKAERTLEDFRRDRLDTVEEMQAFVDRMTKSAWWKKRYPHVRSIRVKDGRGRSAAGGCPYGKFITMPTWSRTKVIVIHEVAHVVTDKYVAAHGWEFCANYVALTQRFLGVEAANRLKRAFKDGKVRFRKPRAKRALTEEQKEVLRERMAKARAARKAT